MPLDTMATCGNGTGCGGTGRRVGSCGPKGAGDGTGAMVGVTSEENESRGPGDDAIAADAALAACPEASGRIRARYTTITSATARRLPAASGHRHGSPGNRTLSPFHQKRDTDPSARLPSRVPAGLSPSLKETPVKKSKFHAIHARGVRHGELGSGLIGGSSQGC